MTDSKQAEVETSKFIESFVQQHWDEQGSACYLSNLGSKLKKDVPESQKVIADGLHEYLRRNPIVKVVQHPEIKQKIGAIPLSVTVPDRIEDLFGKKASSSSDWKWGSYEQVFWDAFIKPIDGEVRFVCLNDTGVEVSDGQASEKKEGCYEITSEDLTRDLAGATIAERVAATHEAINTWLDKNALQQETFSAPKKSLRRSDGDRLDQFLTVFESLSEEDLARISLPLDILLKLSSKK